MAERELNRLDNDSEISILDVVNFLLTTWKKLALSAIVGAVLGLTCWFTLGQYSAEYILLNNTNTNTNTYALDLVSWKIIQKSLPNLAAQALSEGAIPQEQESIFRNLSDGQWWQKNISTSYAISKSDTKDLAGISKDLDMASTTILSLTVTAFGNTKEVSLDNVRFAAKFLRTGGAYLQIRNLLNSYEGETISAVADIAKKITTTQVEMTYQQERARQLEDLHKRFPSNGSVVQQVVDPKESGAKYLPISTQIIAVNNDINQSKELLARLRARLVQIALIKTFLDDAGPLIEKTFDGLLLDEQLLELEAQLRSKLSKDDSNGQEILDQLRAQLLQISVRFTKGLDANTAPTAKRQGMVKSIASGLAAAVFLMILVLLGQQAMARRKAGGTTS